METASLFVACAIVTMVTMDEIVNAVEAEKRTKKTAFDRVTVRCVPETEIACAEIVCAYQTRLETTVTVGAIVLVTV